jgi:hypothetical protein
MHKKKNMHEKNKGGMEHAQRAHQSPRQYLILALGDKDKETCHARAKIS